SDFFTTLTRLHPDPARLLSHYITSYLSAAVHDASEEAIARGSQEGALIILEKVMAKFQALKAMYAEASEWPDPQALLDFLDAWTNAGAAAIQQGDDPWESDEHIGAPSD